MRQLYFRSKKSKENFFWALTFLIFLFVSVNNFISHSEYWAIASARLMGTLSWESVVLYYKPLFYLLLKIPYFFNLSNTEHILISRSLFGTLAFLCFYIFLKNMNRTTRNPNMYFLMGLFLLSFQIYFYNLYRVRADLLATFFLLLAYSRINSLYLDKKELQVFDLKLFVIYSAAFLSTPKSIYLILALFIYQSFLFYKKFKLQRISLQFVNYFLAPVGLTLALFSAFQFIEGLNTHPYAMAVLYQLQSFKQMNDMNSWGHIITSLKINFFHYGLIALGLTLFIRERFFFKKSNRLEGGQVLLFFCTLLILIVHSEKWTYFIAQLIPFLSLPAIFVFQSLPKRRSFQTLILILLLGTPLLKTSYHSWFRSNNSQMYAITQLESFVQQIPDATYFDSTGLLPRAHGKMWFLGPNDPSSTHATILNLRREPPDFIFYTAKLDLAFAEITVFLYENYQEVEQDVWLIKSKTNVLESSNITLPDSLRTLFIYDYLPYLRPSPISF